MDKEQEELGKTCISRNEYLAIHSWIRYKYGSANHCEGISCTGISKRFEWALRKGFQYERNIDAFIPLCKSCHVIYDEVTPRLVIMLKSKEVLDKVNKAKLKPIDQYSIKGELIKTWGSMTEAAQSLGINRNCISTSIIRNHKYKKSIWKFSPPTIKPIK